MDSEWVHMGNPQIEDLKQEMGKLRWQVELVNRRLTETIMTCPDQVKAGKSLPDAEKARREKEKEEREAIFSAALAAVSAKIAAHKAAREKMAGEF